MAEKRERRIPNFKGKTLSTILTSLFRDLDSWNKDRNNYESLNPRIFVEGLISKAEDIDSSLRSLHLINEGLSCPIEGPTIIKRYNDSVINRNGIEELSIFNILTFALDLHEYSNRVLIAGGCEEEYLVVHGEFNLNLNLKFKSSRGNEYNFGHCRPPGNRGVLSPSCVEEEEYEDYEEDECSQSEEGTRSDPDYSPDEGNDEELSEEDSEKELSEEEIDEWFSRECIINNIE